MFAHLRTDRPLRWLNVTLLGTIALAMLGVIYLTVNTIEAERAERAQVTQTNQILFELRKLSSAAVNAETGQRGYLITLDRRYLAPYYEGRRNFAPTLGRIRSLIGDAITSRQSELLDEIERLGADKFNELDRSVSLLEAGALLDARRLVLSDTGQEAMEQLRDALAEMEAIEARILERQAAKTATVERRVLPLLGGLGLLLILAMLSTMRLIARTARAEAEAAQATELAEAHDRADLLAKELNHRVKNLFAVILAIVQMSGRDTPEAKPVIESIATRIRALLTAHEVTQGALDRPVASLAALVDTTLSPYRSASQPAEIDGPEVLLPAKLVTPLGLVLHELTTNAVKYGAWANGGTVCVNWSRGDEQLQLEWRETGYECAAATTGREGFGSMLMKSAARQLSGTIDRKFNDDGCAVTIVIPLEDMPAG